MLWGKGVIGVVLVQVRWILEVTLDYVTRRRILGNFFDLKLCNFVGSEETKVAYG